MTTVEDPEIPDELIDQLVQDARAEGVLHLDEALVTLELELTAEVLTRLKDACSRAGVRLDEGVDTDIDDGDADAESDSADAAPSANGVTATPDATFEVDRTRRRRRMTHTMKGIPSLGGSNDSVRLYLREIGRVELLTAAEEVEIAKRIEAGAAAADRLADLAASGELEALPFDERRALQRAARDHDQATSEMVQANLRLVVSIAKKYERPGMLLLDLIQEGNLGLMRAVEKFDYTKGFKFSTYATWWIRQAITRAIADQARTIRIPVHMVESINKVHRLQRQMLVELKREPTVEELAERADLTPERVREIQTISMDPLSLDKPLDTDGQDSNLADIIGDDNATSPADAAARQMLNQAILEALDELNPREKEVMRLRFGLEDGQPRTLEQVGQEFGVTRERIRQIESKTLAKLRHPHRSIKLRDYLDS